MCMCMYVHVYRADRRCVHRIIERNTNSSMTVHLYKENNKIDISRRVRQEDTILPKLFTTSLTLET